ncbi:MAG: hypothetical protein MUO97_07700 [Dehalococcoidia bacterium]|nr:hypothetical protein [Dehalococcoidia bacterium]
MTAHLTMYEVRVEVEKQGSQRHREISFFRNMRVEKKLLYINVGDKVVKMFHQDARTPEQASKKCEKYGRVISVRKADVGKMNGNLANLRLEQLPILTNAIAMDEMIWRRRNNRIKYRGRDKIGD